MQHLCFSDYAFDRNALKRDNNNWIQSQLASKTSRFLIFSDQKFSVDSLGQIIFMDRDVFEGVYKDKIKWNYLGQNSQSQSVFCSEFNLQLREEFFPDNNSRQWKSLRSIGLKLSPEIANIAIYTQGLLNWHRSTKFCSQCGSTLEIRQAGHLLKCSQRDCHREYFPRTDPAVIVLIHNEDSCLLGRAAFWPENMYSCLAGFVETGEDLNMAVAREIYEESGLSVSNIEYRGSQPWPFPQSIMCGFLAESEGRELIFHDSELEDARWYNREQLVKAVKTEQLKLHSAISISYSLLEDWFNKDCAQTLVESLSR